MDAPRSKPAAVARIALQAREVDINEEQFANEGLFIPHRFSCAGHELALAMVAAHINDPGDAAFTYYRSKAVWFGIGLSLSEYVESAFQLGSSYSGGRNVAVLPFQSIKTCPLIAPVFGGVGSQFEPAIGYAHGLKFNNEQQALAFVFAGDGAVATGGFWSIIRESASRQLPIVIVIENNGIALSTDISKQIYAECVTSQIADFPGLETKVYDATHPGHSAEIADVINNCRKIRRPVLIELKVDRISGHSASDRQAYRTSMPACDPLSRLDEICDQDFSLPELAALKAEIEIEVQETFKSTACKIETKIPISDVNFDCVTKQAAQFKRPFTLINQYGANKVSIGHAINNWLVSAMRHDSKLILLGEDIGKLGGVHGVTRGLLKQFGQSRVVDTSLNESCIVGQAMGLALCGFRPIVEIQYRKYLDPGMEQFRNIGWCGDITNGLLKLPIIIRIPFGSELHNDPWHSESDEATVLRSLGYDVFCPATSRDAVEVLDHAFVSGNPTVVLEHRGLYYDSNARESLNDLEQIAQTPRCVRMIQGNDLTIVSWGKLSWTVNELLKSRPDLNVELIRLVCLRPWDAKEIRKSVQKTGRLLVIHEDRKFLGLGAEIASEIAEKEFCSLRCPVERLAAQEVPVPILPELVSDVIPSSVSIENAIKMMLSHSFDRES